MRCPISIRKAFVWLNIGEFYIKYLYFFNGFFNGLIELIDVLYKLVVRDDNYNLVEYFYTAQQNKLYTCMLSEIGDSI